MNTMFKKTIIALVIFMAIPITAIAINWYWQPESTDSISRYLLWITESAGSPWALITATLLFVLFCLFLKTTTIRRCFVLWLILFLAVLSGQIMKSIIKYSTHEPRPYVVLMEETAHINQQFFYALPKAEKKAVIQQFADQNETIPHWLATQWQSETDYSLPSGHTLFATTWTFLALLLLGFKRHRIVISILIIWSVLIEISRLVLGMHHPLDLIAGIILAWLIAGIGYWGARKWQLIK